MSGTTPSMDDVTGDLDIDFTYELLPENLLQFDLSYKIIVIGDCSVGKSCLTNRATINLFEDAYTATVGFEFLNFNIKIDGKIIKLQIWDTCGQELYRSLITNFYRNASLAIIVYAVNSRDSFENIEMWLRELRTHSNPDVKIFLIGNKIDLDNERVITKDQGEKFCKNNKLNLFIETSAKNGTNIQELFKKAAILLYREHASYTNMATKLDNSLKLPVVSDENLNIWEKDEEENSRKNKCCK